MCTHETIKCTSMFVAKAVTTDSKKAEYLRKSQLGLMSALIIIIITDMHPLLWVVGLIVFCHLKLVFVNVM